MDVKNRKVRKVPLHLDIELNNDCNLQCDMCPNHSPRALYFPEVITHMDFTLYKKIIDEAVEKGVCAVKLAFRGEPLLYRKLPQAVFYAKNQGIMGVMINSNGLLLGQALLVQLMISGLDTFILSDYGFKKQVEIGHMIQATKKLFHFDIPKLIVKTNDAPRWYTIADEITESTFYDYNSGEECLEASSFECEQLYQRLVILADGRVKVCCSSVLFEDGIIGDMHEHTIEELWNGDYMQYIRFCHANGRANLIKSCRYCPGLIEYVRLGKK